jgi:uncharacterized lipoprotein
MPATVSPARWQRQAAIASLLLIAGTLAACFSSRGPDERCDEVSEYQASRSVPGLVVPDGLSAPGGASTYVVPPAGNAAAAGEANRGAACLARPPDFFRSEPEPTAK